MPPRLCRCGPCGRPNFAASVSAMSASVVANADRTCGRAGAEGEDRHVLARVVEALVGRVVAMVRGEEAIVVRPHRRLDLVEAPVERLEAGGEAGHVAAMAPLRVEVDEVHEDDTAVRRLLQGFEQQVDVAVVAPAFDLAPGVAMGENVADLADRDDGAARSPRRAGEYCRRAAAWRNPCDAACGRSLSRSSRGTAARSPARRSTDRTGAGRGDRGRTAVRGRTPPRARRSGTPNRPRCSRSAFRSAGAPRRTPR